MQDVGIRVKVDSSFQSLGYRLRNAQLKKVPVTIVVGDKEVSENTLTYRIIQTKEQITIPKDELIKSILKNIQDKTIKIEIK